MIHYEINYNRLALSLVPICLRKAILMNLLYVMMGQVSKESCVFSQFRSETDYRIIHNGQVCYLRGVLNDKFDWQERRIIIEDVTEGEGTILYKRELSKFLMVPEQSTGKALVINKRAFTGSDSVDFAVVVPASLRGNFVEEQMRALIDTYKLASKRYTITYR